MIDKITLKNRVSGNDAFPYTWDSIVGRTGGTTVKDALDALEAGITGGSGDQSREYDSTKNVQGYMVLQPNTGSVYAQLVGKENYIIEVRDIIDLDGEDITIPEGCTLKFEGGELTNGTVNFQNTGIEATRECFGDDLVITGKVLQEASPEWFSGSDADKIEKAVDIFSVVKLAARDYLLDRTVHIHHSFRLNGSSIPNCHNSAQGGANQYGTHSPDWSSTRIMPTVEFSRSIAKIVLDIDDDELDYLLNPTNPQNASSSQNAVKAALRSVYKNSGSYTEDVVKERLNGVIPSLISVTPPTSDSAYFSAVISGVSFIVSRSGIVKWVINGIDWSTPGGPSRPFVVENCNFMYLNKGLYLYGSKSSPYGKSTNCSTWLITGNNMKANNVAIQAEGQHASGNWNIQSNVIEQNSYYGIYCPRISEVINDSTVRYTPIMGYVRIANNLLEGQADPIYMRTDRCFLLIEGNYYESPSGSTITVYGARADQCEVTIQRNTTSTNIPSGGVVYNITDNTVHYSSKSIGTFNLVECVVDPSDANMKKANLSQCVSVENGKNELNPVAVFKYNSNSFYNNIPCLREIVSTTTTESTYTLTEPLAAGNYVLAFFSSNPYVNTFMIGNTEFIHQSSIYPYNEGSYFYRYHVITVDETVPAGTVLKLQYRRPGKYSTAYLFPVGSGIYDLPKIDLTNTKIAWSSLDKSVKDENGLTFGLHRGTTDKRPAYLSLSDVGYQYFDTNLLKNTIFRYKNTLSAEQTVTGSTTKYIDIPSSESGIIYFSITSSYAIEGNIELSFVKAQDDESDKISLQGKMDYYTNDSGSPRARLYYDISGLDGYTKIKYSNNGNGNRNIHVYTSEPVWIEEDGAIAGVAREGDTRPIGRNIYVGFEFFDTTLGKPIYASAISGDTVTWVDSTGTTVS